MTFIKTNYGWTNLGHVANVIETAEGYRLIDGTGECLGVASRDDFDPTAPEGVPSKGRGHE
jgi:hypothetical protein